MEDFTLGLAFGVLLTSVITTPFLTYFGIIYINLRRMEKKLDKEINKRDIEIIPEVETIDAIRQAEEILAKRKEIVV